jgi:hypothetical protein
MGKTMAERMIEEAVFAARRRAIFAAINFVLRATAVVALVVIAWKLS